MKKLIFIICFILLFPALGLAAEYYVDCSLSDPETTSAGTYANPFYLISEANAQGYATGDDVYFKVNTTCNLTEATGFEIDWVGTVGNRAIIGAYYGDGLFGLNGQTRPILDGQSRAYPSSAFETGGIQRLSATDQGSTYITVKDLHIYNVKSHGVVFKYHDDLIVDNVYTQNTIQRGIMFARCNNGVIQNSTVERASYNTTPGGGIVITGVDETDSADGNQVIGNTVFHNFEGIGAYKKATNTIIENNIVYDNRQLGIYAETSKNTIIRYNLVYYSSDTGSWDGPDEGILIDNEDAGGYCFTGGHEVYGNFIAGALYGIIMGSDIQQQGTDANCDQDNNLFYNNTIVDSVSSNFCFWQAGAAGWSGNEFKNNISVIFTAGSQHTCADTHDGDTTWTTNTFDNSIDTVSGDASASNYSTSDPSLVGGSSGWRSLTAGAVTTAPFKLTVGSVCIDSGTDIGTYPTDDFARDYWLTNRDTYTPWDIGAHEFEGTPPSTSGAAPFFGVYCQGCKFNQEIK